MDVAALTRPSVLAQRSGVKPTAVNPQRRSITQSSGPPPVPQAKLALVNRTPDVRGLAANVNTVA
ncbi:MAG: hypothetical protein RL326_2265 [Pseudomonadota bacterium]|jgi:hypothetical protein